MPFFNTYLPKLLLFFSSSSQWGREEVGRNTSHALSSTFIPSAHIPLARPHMAVLSCKEGGKCGLGLVVCVPTDYMKRWRVDWDDLEAKVRSWGMATLKGRGGITNCRHRRNGKQCAESQRRRGF